MKTYLITYNFKGFSNQQEVLGKTVLDAISNFLTKTDLPLTSIREIILKP